MGYTVNMPGAPNLKDMDLAWILAGLTMSANYGGHEAWHRDYMAILSGLNQLGASKYFQHVWYTEGL